ncbi:NUDIX hydrolase [Halobacillus litoralis]|uniref:NUDIX hydrolase n=1 Tax=Halobacillus litoralis TaxID=45668 RepID=UPI001CD56A38|nr:NUDIX hydrolase [Halobacillus litoralis]MCA0972277.1 NUDIX hydrolase [Halobacillus litoralis]
MDVRFEKNEIRFNYRAAGVMVEEGHVLFHRQKDDAYWALPGGGVEMGESTEESIVREWQEELGEAIDIDSTLWIAESFFTYQSRLMHELAFYYSVRREDGRFTKEPFHGLEGDHLVYQWLPVDELHRYDIRPDFLKERLQAIPEKPVHLIDRRE